MWLRLVAGNVLPSPRLNRDDPLASLRSITMVTGIDQLHALLNLQRALERSYDSDWLRGSTTGMGAFPLINIFQRADDFVALVELPGVSKADIEIQAKESSIRVSGRKTISFQEGASVHRRERVSGVFNRTISLPVAVDADRVTAE
jgi:HSP20 family protein